MVSEKSIRGRLSWRHQHAPDVEEEGAVAGALWSRESLPSRGGYGSGGEFGRRWRGRRGLWVSSAGRPTETTRGAAQSPSGCRHSHLSPTEWRVAVIPLHWVPGRPPTPNPNPGTKLIVASWVEGRPVCYYCITKGRGQGSPNLFVI